MERVPSLPVSEQRGLLGGSSVSRGESRVVEVGLDSDGLSRARHDEKRNILPTRTLPVGNQSNIAWIREVRVDVQWRVVVPERRGNRNSYRQYLQEECERSKGR